MTLSTKRVGEIVTLVREPLVIDATEIYTSIGIRSFGRGIFHYDPVEGAGLSKLRWFALRPDELIVSNIKAWEGAIAVTSRREEGCIASNRFLTYQARHGETDVRFLRYFFLSEPGLELIGRASPGSADRNRTLAIDRFEDLVLQLPPLEEQQRIADRLDRLDDQCARAASLRAVAAEISTALFTSALHTDAPMRKVSDLVEQVSREEVVEPEQTYSLLGVRWYAEGMFIRERKLGSEVAAKKLNRVATGDFVYNRLFGWKGSFAIATEEVDGGYVSGEFPIFRASSDEVDIRYLASVFGDPVMWVRVADLSTGGTPTSRNRLKESAFLAMDVPLPSIEDQRRIAGIIEKVRRVRRMGGEQARYITALRAAALNQSLRQAGVA